MFCSEKNIKTVVLLALLTFKMASARILYVYLYSYEAFLALYVEIHSTITSTDNIPAKPVIIKNILYIASLSVTDLSVYAQRFCAVL